jgi:hypothetical protein
MLSKNAMPIVITVIILSLITIASRGFISCKYGHLAAFLLMILVAYTITRKPILSVILTLVIWIILFVIRRNYLGIELFAVSESFENGKDEHKDPDTKKRVKDMNNLIKKLEGGISLKDEDLFEKNNLDNHNFSQNKESEKERKESDVKGTDELKPHEAQRQAYQLIDTVKQLKDTIHELAPMLKQGKTVLEQLETLKM